MNGRGRGNPCGAVPVIPVLENRQIHMIQGPVVGCGPGDAGELRNRRIGSRTGDGHRRRCVICNGPAEGDFADICRGGTVHGDEIGFARLCIKGDLRVRAVGSGDGRKVQIVP